MIKCNAMTVAEEIPIPEELNMPEELATEVGQRVVLETETPEPPVLPRLVPGAVPELSELNKRFFGEFDGFRVFLISGEYVRNNLEADFTMGSHHFVSDFIPEGEVWLDDKMSDNDRIALIHHEVHETRLMKKGMCYEEAHASATRSELRLRKKKFNNKHRNLPLTLFCPFNPHNLQNP